MKSDAKEENEINQFGFENHNIFSNDSNLNDSLIENRSNYYDNGKNLKKSDNSHVIFLSNLNSSQYPVLITSINGTRLNQYNTYGLSSNKKKKIRKKKKVRNTNINQFDNDDSRRALNRLIKKGDVPELNIRNSVILLARNDSINAALNENYDQADVLENAVSTLLKKDKKDQENFEIQCVKKEMMRRLEESENDKKQSENYWNKMISEQKELALQQKESLKMQHEYEIRLFQEKWQNPNSLIPFTKPSPELLQMRRKQRAAALSHNFEIAKAMKIKADHLQKIETEMAQRNATKAMQAEYIILLEKHQKEIEVVEMNYNRKLNTLQIEKNEVLKAAENRSNQLTMKVQNPIVQKKQPVLLPVVDKKDPMLTFTMRKRYTKYKKSPEKMRLDVKQVDTNIIRKMNDKREKTSRKSKE